MPQLDTTSALITAAASAGIGFWIAFLLLSKLNKRFERKSQRVLSMIGMVSFGVGLSGMLNELIGFPLQGLNIRWEKIVTFVIANMLVLPAIFVGIAFALSKKEVGATIIGNSPYADSQPIQPRKQKRWYLAFIPVGIIAIVVALIVMNEDNDLTKNTLVKEFKGIRLGDSYEDFMFRANGFEAKKKSNTGKDRLTTYTNSENNLAVDIKDNHVVQVKYACGDKDATLLNGITCFTDGDQVLKRFGNMVIIKCNKLEEYIKWRVYDVPKYGARYGLFENKVVAFDIADAESINDNSGFMNSSWGSCK